MLTEWDEVEIDLRVETTLALDEGRGPVPLLVAFAGEQPVALTALRPLTDGDALSALVEVLAFLLPLGTDRVALALPGVAQGVEPGPEDDVASSVVEPGRLLVLVATAEAGVDGPRLHARLHPLERREGRWQWLAQTVEVDADDLHLTRAIGVLLDRRQRLEVPADGELHRQLARCVLLGHHVQVSGEVAQRLEPDLDLRGQPTDRTPG